MFSNIIYLELFIAFFFLPGFFITVILGIKKIRFLLSFALSYSLLVLSLLPFEFYGGTIAGWQGGILSAWIILAVLAVGKTFRNFNIARFMGRAACRSPVPFAAQEAMAGGRQATCPPSLSDSIGGLLNPRLMVPLALAAVICGYLAYAGPYLEMPADAWEHVRRFKLFEIGALEEGVFAGNPSLAALLGNRLRWYFFHAWLCHVSGLPVIDSLHVLTFVNLLFFSLAIYYFGLFLFAGLRASAFKKMMMAAFASLFAAAAMGNMVFAYIRYYAFAPAILNYVLFLAAMAVIIFWMRSKRWLGHALWMAPVLLLVTGLIHAQETLFIFFMTLALSMAEIIRIFWRKILPTPASGRPSEGGELILPPSWDGRGDNRRTTKEWKAVILCAFLITVFFAGFAVVRHFRPGAWISADMIMPGVGVPSEPVSLVFRNLMIVPPQDPFLRLAAYQLFIFYQVIGCWGLFVYLLFLLMIRHFIKMPYLTAGMIIVPLLTSFNPLTVDMFARLDQSAAIYRFHYMIPLPFAAGYLFVHFRDKARLSAAGIFSSIRPRTAWIAFAGCMLELIGLIGLLFPVNAGGIYAPYSKIYTLRRIPAGNDYRLYADLGKFMAQYERKVILSDGWTSGFLWNYSPKNTYGWLPWFGSPHPEKDRPDPYTWENLRGRGLIVVNCRDGALSIAGKIAGHWPEDRLNVSRLYSPEARRYLESRPEKFRKIWRQNQIAVYAVR